MRRGPSILSLIAVLLLSACTSKTEAPIYNYGMNKTGAGTLGIHTVQSGDTPYTISQKYNLDLRELLETNKLSPPYNLSSGTRLKLPAPQTYTVRGNDSLYTISRLFNTTQTDLVRLNNLSAPYKVSSGQTLKIPKVYGEDGSIIQAAQAAPVESVEIAPVETASVLPLQTLPLVATPPQPAPAVTTATPHSEIKTAEIKTVSVAPSQPVPASTGQFIKPVSGKIISNFGPKADGQHNDGINIKAAKGDAVRAADNGKVVYVGDEIHGYGNMILIKHQNKYVTAYAHLAKSLVKKGDVVMRGQTIGTVGQTGFVDTPQLHFEVRQGKTAIDPAKLI